MLHIKQVNKVKYLTIQFYSLKVKMKICSFYFNYFLTTYLFLIIPDSKLQLNFYITLKCNIEESNFFIIFSFC